MNKQLSISNKLQTAYWSAVALLSGIIVSIQPTLAADTIWNRFSTIMKDVYGEIVAISTIVAVTVAAIALVVRMVSRNQRAVDEATSWLKRIIITWIVLNSLGFVVAYLQPLIPVSYTHLDVYKRQFLWFPLTYMFTLFQPVILYTSDVLLLVLYYTAFYTIL